MKVSIISLVYNNIYPLFLSVDSLVRQEYRNLEYIILEDSSIPIEVELLQKVFDKLDEFDIDYKYCRNDCNIGTVRSFNRAISEASGDIIVALSPGDFFLNKNVVGRIASEFSAGVDILSYSSLLYRSKPYDMGETYKQSKRHRFFLAGNNVRLLKYIVAHGNIISGASTSYRKKFLLDNGGFDERFIFLEDYPFFIKTLATARFRYIKEPLIHYQLGGVSTSGPNPKLLKDYNTLFNVINTDYAIDVKLKRMFNLGYRFTFDSRFKAFLSHPIMVTALIFEKLLRRI